MGQLGMSHAGFGSENDPPDAWTSQRLYCPIAPLPHCLIN